MTKPAFTCDLGYGVEHFSDLQQISDRQLNDITPRTGSTAWHRRIARRGGDMLGAPIMREGVLFGRVSYNGRVWEAGASADCRSPREPRSMLS